MLREYLDFEIRISSLDVTRFAVYVSGPGGETNGTLVLPTSNPAYQTLITQVEHLDTDEEVLVSLGTILFDALFHGPVKDVYVRSQGTLGDGRGMRLRFTIDLKDAAVATLPWEFLSDPDQGPLAMLDAPIVRYIPLQDVVPKLATRPPLKALISGAITPPAPQVERELAEVQSALMSLEERVQMTLEPHLTRQKLMQYLRDGFHIWHFIGHGGVSRDGKTGTLLFEDSTGSSEAISARELSILLDRSGVRLVLLDSCNSAKLLTDPFRSVAPALIRSQIGAVIAMQFAVPEEATRVFACEFYRSLAEGFPVDACVTEGRRAVMSSTGLGRPDWGIPVVYTRARDGQLFELPPAPPTSSPSTQSGAVQIAIGGNVTNSGVQVSEVGHIQKGTTSGSTVAPADTKQAAQLRDELAAKRLRLKQQTAKGDQRPEVAAEILRLRDEIAELERRLRELGIS